MLAVLAIVGLSVSFAASAVTFTENFTNDPSADGWQIFGDTNLFQWNSTDWNLAVTWDSSQPNSYFYHPLGVTLTKEYDFTIEFDLQLNDITTGNEANKTSPMAIGIGFLNFANATNSSFGRGIYGGAPNVAEWDYFAPGSWTDGINTYPLAPTLTPTFISSSAYSYAPSAYIPYEIQFPTGKLIHVTLDYTGTNEMLTVTFQTNGVDCLTIPAVMLSDDFGTNDDFAVNTFSISSYSSTNDPYDSVLAHGIVSNIVVTVPPPAIQNLTGAFSNSVWQTKFIGQIIWNYTLQRTTDLQAWSDVVPAPGGDGTQLTLSDTNPPSGNSFYRIKAVRK